MRLVLSGVQMGVGVILSALVLLQSKGTGLSRSMFSASYHSRRGLEKLVFKTTVVLAVVFVLISLGVHFV